ncbi:MAG TPA: Hpt domain-containing protein, partial [Verrucomicrobiae bacterium]|nr:Hpt domain-containing protein [Verrucomicrobiae bacterium]
MDMSQYRDLFVSESSEHLRSLAELVVALEKEADTDKVNALFRHAHSVKGMAAAMQYDSIARLAHVMENLLDRVRKAQFPLGPAGGDLLLEGADLLESMIADVSSGGSGEADIVPLTARLEEYRGDAAAIAADAEAPAPRAAAEEPAAEPSAARRPSRGAPTVRVRTDLLDRLVTVTGELLTTRHHIAALAREEGEERMAEPVGALSRLLRELHDTVLQVRMMPFGTVTDTLPRVVRDLARRSGKVVDLEVAGDDIELDRGVLEELGDPLVH